MNKFVNFIKATLFDSTSAHFRLTIESRLTRRRTTDQSLESLCYVDAKGNMTLNPNIYLVFTYRGDTIEESKSLYTSYPQLAKFRNVFGQVSNILCDDSAYTNIEGIEEVAPSYKNPIVLADIGKDKKWISFTPTMVAVDDVNRERGVIVQISGSDLASALTIDEFLTINDIIQHLDLVQYHIAFGLFAIQNNDTMAPQQSMYGQMPQQPYYNGGYVQPTTTPQIPGQNYYMAGGPQYGTPNRAPAAPRYNNNPVRRTTTTAPQYTQNPSSTGNAGQSRTYNNIPAPTQQNVSRQPIVNMTAVEETPVDNTDWNDDEVINNLFEDNN